MLGIKYLDNYLEINDITMLSISAPSSSSSSIDLYLSTSKLYGTDSTKFITVDQLISTGVFYEEI